MKAQSEESEGVSLVSPQVGALVIAALVESCHGLICRAGLHLHEVSSGVFALWASCLGGINVFPSSRSSQHVINFLQFRICSAADFAINVENVRASAAGESKTLRSFFNTQ